jgi:mono/diheme cytochrome c family protein
MGKPDMKTALIVACMMLATVGGLVFGYSAPYDAAAMNPRDPVVVRAPQGDVTEPVAYEPQAPQPPPDLEKPESVQAGARLFRDNCVVCHGAPGIQASDGALALQPSPPDLLRAARRNDPSEVFSKVTNGIKMTAMPAFGEILSDEQIWTLAAFLHASRGIAAQDFQTLSEPAKTGG